MAPRAVVTGGARGIGAAVASVLNESGFSVVRVDITPAEGVEVCDVADPSAVQDLARRVGQVDLLVNNAAIWKFGPLETVDPQDFFDVLQVNLLGAFHCIRFLGSRMLDGGGGCIVNVASVAAAHPNPSVGGYAASKAGLVALTEQTALEWGPRGVRCNAVAPGLVRTPGTRDVYGNDSVEAARARAVPVGRLGAPADIASAVAFLASPSASYINGQVLHVDGGLSRALMSLVPRAGRAEDGRA